MAKKNETERAIRLLTSIPSKEYKRMVVRYPNQTDKDYAFAYHHAAGKLASTFGGNPTDDLILLPFLTLYRQAFELQLKNTIRALVTFRAMYHEGWTFELKKSISAERFRDSNHLGHNLYRLLAEAKKHFAALNLPEKFPKSLETIVLEFHEADKSGTAFRYAGYLPDTQEYTDFPDLVKKLDEVFDLLLAVVDYAEDHYKSMPTLNES